MINKAHEYLSIAVDAINRSNYDAALRNLQLAIDLGSSEAKIELAEFYLAGRGVEPDGVVAERLLTSVIDDKSAPQKLVALALHNLSSLHFTGSTGITPDAAKAAYLASRAKELGFPQ